jgi:hypothetical protein
MTRKPRSVSRRVWAIKSPAVLMEWLQRIAAPVAFQRVRDDEIPCILTITEIKPKPKKGRAK